MTQAERREQTREILLDATIQALVVYGYSGATSARIAELAHLTRGAQLHHFGDKAQMMVEALLHLQRRRLESLQDRWRADAAGASNIRGLLELLWETFKDELFVAGIELRVASRTDRALRDALLPAEREIGRTVTALVQAHPTLHALPSDIVEHVLEAMRGMALAHILEPSERRERRQLVVLERVVRDALEEAVRA
jgi:AcrR family transcriptional regulator